MTLPSIRTRCSAWFACKTAQVAALIDSDPLESAAARRRVLVAQCVVMVAIAAYAGPAQAYMGEQMLNMVANRVLAPLALFAIVGGVIAYMFAPQHGKTILGIVIGVVVLFAIVRSGSTVVGWINDTSLDH
jgi:hypothetical protein